MICPHCRADMGKINAAGEPLVRNRGLVLKSESVAVVCPRCKGDVPLSTEMAKALQAKLTIFFKRRPPP